MLNILLNKYGLILLAAGLLGGCVSPERPLYNWDSYQSVVYEYYQTSATSPQEQIAALQKSIELSRSYDLSVPPGLYAHLGMLHSGIGNIDEAYHYFRLEKQLFPESAPFMDFLLSSAKGGAK